MDFVVSIDKFSIWVESERPMVFLAAMKSFLSRKPRIRLTTRRGNKIYDEILPEIPRGESCRAFCSYHKESPSKIRSRHGRVFQRSDNSPLCLHSI